MRSTSIRLALAVIVFVAALAGALLLLRSGDSGSGASTTARDGGAAASSDIWSVGDSWTVQVKQDAGAIAPGGDTNVASIPFTFTVTTAPEDSDGAWIVKVTQEGAEGPFAAGWRLHYVERDGVMELSRVAIGEDTPLEAEIATIVLGSQFPYEVRYERAPKDATVTAADLLERAALPPSTKVPGSGPKGGPTGAPTAPPLSEAVAPGGDSKPAAPKQ